MPGTTSDLTVVLVHGACHGPSCWNYLRAELNQRGLPSVAVDLPSSGGQGDSLGDLAADAEAVRAEVDRVDRAVVVAHSYGGAAVTQGLVGVDNVSLLIYLTAFMLEIGESIMVAGDDGRDEQWVVSDDGKTIHAADPAAVFYNRCSPDRARQAVGELRQQNVVPFTERVSQTAWRGIESAYVLCGDDQAIRLDRQERMAQRAGVVERLDTDHSPFLSAPVETAALIDRLSRST